MKNLHLISENVNLASFTSWQIGGPAEFFANPKTIEELKEVLSWAKVQSLPVNVLGGGSNVLIHDRGLKGLCVVLDHLKKIEVKTIPSEAAERLVIEAEAGVGKNELLKIFLKYKLAPALFLAGIPGTVGGGVVMNAGVAENFTPREFCEITDWVEVLTPQFEVKRIPGSQLDWSYRHCNGWQPGWILRAGMSWPLQPDADVLEKVKNANRIRLTKQPLDWPSCGSVFVNPEGHKAAQLIDSSGLKGFTKGGAQVSEKHANFIINTGSAKAEDIAFVIEHVRTTVKKLKSVELKTEVVFMGF